MAKAIQPFYWDGKFYDVDSDVPDEVASKLGPSIVDDPPEVDTSGFDGDEAFEAAVEARVQAAGEASVSEAVEKAVTEQIERERAAVDALAAADEPYDPSAYKADEVHGYLSGLDTDTVAGADEYDRVVEAEQAGDNRKTAIPAPSSDD